MEILQLSQALREEITAIVFGAVVEVEPCDVIFVFGGSHPGLWKKTAEAYFLGLGKRIVVTGGYNPAARRHPTWSDGTTPEAHVIRRELVRLQVPEQVIISEGRSTNSLENVLFAKQVFDFQPVGSILVICKSYGTGRQCRTLQKHIRERVKIIPYPFDTMIGGKGPIITRENWMDYPHSFRFVINEVVKIYQYGRSGHLQVVEGLSNALLELIQKQLTDEFP
jgi:uncharacterized SAM-binding protein YcdF (DUF218 family)